MITISSAEEFHAAVAAATEKPLVACFSAPWCGGCKLVAPKVANLAEELVESVSFAKVGAEDLETLCEEVEVDSFPHFRVYKAGKVLGDYTSSKFDKVDAFIRGLVAPDTVEKAEETPEDEAAQETVEKEVPAQSEAEGSTKRREREEMEANDEQVAKKAKTEEEESKEADKSETEETAENLEEAPKDETEKVDEETENEVTAEVAEKKTEKAAEETEKETTAEVSEKEKDEAVFADKLEVSEAAEVGSTSADAAAA